MFANIQQQIGTAIIGFTGVGSVIAGIQKAAHAIVMEYQNLMGRRTERAAKQISLADAQFELHAATDGGALSYKELDSLVNKISSSTLADHDAIYNSLANTIGAARGTSIGGHF